AATTRVRRGARLIGVPTAPPLPRRARGQLRRFRSAGGDEAEFYQRDVVARGDEDGFDGHPWADVIGGAVDDLAHEVDLLVHEDVDDVVGNLRLEGRERRTADDRPRPHRAASRGALPRERSRMALRARGAWVVAEAAARGAALEDELAATRRLVERRAVPVREWEREAPGEDRLAERHRRSRTAPVASVLPPATNA